MSRNLPPLKALAAFEAAARHLSFTRAAEELGVTQGAVSYQIRQLETHLGAALFIRRIREVHLTGDGIRMARLCVEMFEKLAQETKLIRRSAALADDILIVAVSTYVATRFLSKRLNGFLEEHPTAAIRLQHSVNAPGFAIEDVDIAIRWGDGHWPGTKAELLLPMKMRPMCSPRLIKGTKRLAHPRDLVGHTLLCEEPNTDLWSEWLDLAGLERSQFRQEQVLADSNVRVQAAIDGQGVVLADDLVADEIAAGRLVEPFPQALDSYGYYLLRPVRSGARSISQAFIAWLRAQVR